MAGLQKTMLKELKKKNAAEYNNSKQHSQIQLFNYTSVICFIAVLLIKQPYRSTQYRSTHRSLADINIDRNSAHSTKRSLGDAISRRSKIPV